MPIQDPSLIENPNLVGINTLPKAPVQKKTYDFFDNIVRASTAMGKDYDPNDHLIDLQIKIKDNPQTDVALYDRETLWKKNEKKYGGNRAEFDAQYDYADKLYKGYRKNELDYFSYNTPTTYFKALGFKPASGVGIVVDSKPLANYGAMTKFAYNVTPDEMAAMSGKYTDKQGVVKDFTWKEKYNPFKALIVDQNIFTGEYSLKETSMTEDLNNQRMYSFWGSQSKYGNAIMNSVGSFFSELLPGSVEVAANIGKIKVTASQDLGKFATGEIKTSEEFLKAQNVMGAASLVGNYLTGTLASNMIEDLVFDQYLPSMKKDTLNAIANFANRMKFNPSEEAETAGWFGSMEGFMTQLGRGLAYLVPQKGAAMLTVKLLSKAAAKNLTKQFVAKYGAEEGTKIASEFLKKNGPLLSKGDRSVINTMGFGVGTLQAISGVYSAGKEHGLSDSEATWMSVTAAPFVYATEKFIGGGWLWPNINNAIGKGEIKESLGKWLKHEITENGFKSAKELGEKNYINISKNLISSFIKGSRDLGKGVLRKGWNAPVVGAGMKEGSQEFLEETLYVGQEMFFDKIKEIDGQMASYNTELTSDETIKRLTESWFGGFFIGGFADGINKAMSKGQANDQKDLIMDAIKNGKTEDLYKYMEELKTAGEAGPTHLDANGNTITKEQEGNVESMNDINYKNAIQQIQFYENLYKAGGLDTKEVIDNLGGDKNLVQEGMDNLLSQYNINKEIDVLNSEKEKAQKSGFQIEQFEKDINSKQQELDKFKTDYKDLVSGKRLANITKETLIKANYEKGGDTIAGGDIVTPANQDKFNGEIIVNKKNEINRLKNEKEKLQAEQIKASGVVDAFEKLDVNNFNQEFGESIAKINTLVSEGSLSKKDSEKLTAQIEKKKAEVIASLEQTFDDLELKTFQAQATISEEQGLDEETYIAELLTKAKEEPVLRTDIKIGDTVQKIDKEGNLIDNAAPVVGINEDGTLVLNEIADPVSKEEVKNITAQEELDEDTDYFNRRSGMDNAYQSLAGLRNKYVDLDEAYGYTDEKFTEALYTSVLQNGKPESIANLLQRVSGVSAKDKDNLSEEEYRRALREAPLMQLPENKTMLENTLKLINTSLARVSVNWNVYQKLDRKMSGLIDDNTITEEQFITINNRLKDLKKETEYMLNVMESARLDREARQSTFRIQNLKISHFLLSESLQHVKGDDNAKLNSILMNAKTESDNLEKLAAKGTKVSIEDWIPFKKLINSAETLLYEIMQKDPSVSENSIKSIIDLHKMKTTAYTAASEFNQNTVDDMLNVGNFVTPADLNKTSISQAYLKQMILFYSVNYYQNISRLRQDKFASAFKAVIDETSKDEHVVSFEQESIINHAISFLNNPSNELIEVASKTIKSANIDNFLWNTLFLRGYYGTGKTKIIAKTILKVWAKFLGRKPRVLVVAPSNNIKNKLLEAISDDITGSNSMTNSAFLTDGEGIINNYDLVLIDEASRLGDADISRINEIVNGEKSNKTIKVIAMGDQSQMQSTTSEDFQLPIELRTERTMPATEVFRTGVQDIWVVLEDLRVKMRSITEENNFTISPTKYEKDKNSGVHQIKTNQLKDITDEYLKDILSNPENAQKTDIVTFTKKDRANVLNLLLAEPKLLEIIDQKTIESKVWYLDEGDQMAQGEEFQRVYVAIVPSMMPPKMDSTILLSRAIITAASRVTNFLAIPNIDGESTPGLVATSFPETKETKEVKSKTLRDWWGWASPFGEEPLEAELDTEELAPILVPTRQEALSKAFPNIDLSQKSIDIIAERSDKRAIAFIDEYDAINAKYDELDKLAALEKPVKKKKVVSKKKAKKDIPPPIKNQNPVSDEDLEKRKIILGDFYVNKTTGVIVKPTRAFKNRNVIMLVLDGDEENPINSTKFAYDYKQQEVPVEPEELEPIGQEAPGIETTKLSSKLFVNENKATFGLLSNEGAPDQDNPDDIYVRFKKALISHLSSGNIPVTLFFESKIRLATDQKRLQTFANVVSVRYTDETDLKRIAERLKIPVDLIDFSKASLLGTLPQPSLADQSYAESSNYFQSSDVVKLLDSVTGDEVEQKWGKFLIQIRQQLAVSGKPFNINFLGVKRGGFKTIDDNLNKIPFSQLLTTLRKKGYHIDTNKLVFDNKIKGKSGEVYSSVVAYASAVPGIAETRIILDSQKVDDAYFKKLIAAAKKLKDQTGLNWDDIDNSDSFKALLFNSSRLYKNKIERVLGINKFLISKIDGWVDLRGTTAVKKADNLIEALTLLHNYFLKSEQDIKHFNQLVGKRTEFGKYLVDPNGSYWTRVEDINFPTGILDVTSIRAVFDQAAKNNVVPPNTVRKPYNPKDVDFSPKTKPNPDKLTVLEKRESRAVVQEYYNGVFGKDFLENRLEFKRNLALNDDELYGLVTKGIAYLEETEEGIEIYTKRHEASHIGTNYLVDPETRQALWNDAKELIAELSGQDPLYIGNKEADEFIANRYETRYEGIGGIFNRLIDRFIAWLDRVFKNGELYKEDINAFLYAIESGRFKDQPFYDNDSEVVSPKKKGRKGADYKIQKFGEEDNIGGVEDSNETGEDTEIFEEEEQEVTDWTDEDYTRIYGGPSLKAKQDLIANKRAITDYASLVGVFGTIEQLNLIRRRLAATIINSSLYDRDIRYEGINLIELLREVRDSHAVYAKTVPELGEVLDKKTQETYTEYDQINGTNIHYLSEAQKKNFIIYKLGNENIFNKFIKRMLPAIDFQREDLGLLAKAENDSRRHEEWAIEEALIGNNEMNIGDANDTKDPFTKKSQHVSFHLNNMLLNNYGYDTNGNRVFIGQSNNFVNSEILQTFLIQAAIDSQLPANESEKSLNQEERFSNIIKTIAQTATIPNTIGEDTNNIADSLWTFYDTFLNNQPLVSVDKNGYEQVSYSHKYLQSHQTELLLSFPELSTSIIQKSENSSDILNAVLVYVSSLRKNTFVQFKMTRKNKGEDITIEKVSASPHEISRQKNDLNEKMLSTMFTNSGISDVFIDTMLGKMNNRGTERDKKTRFFNISDDIKNIFLYRSGQNIPLLSVTYKGGLPVFELSENINPADITGTFKKFGILVAPRVVNLFLSNNDPTGQLKHPYTRQSLAEILGMYIFTGVSATTEGGHPIKGIVNNYYTKKGFKRDSINRLEKLEKDLSNEAIVNRQSVLSDNKEFFDKPIDLFPLTEILANAINITYGKSLSNYYLSVNGSKKVLITYKAFLDIFLSQTSSADGRTTVGQKLKLNNNMFIDKNSALRHLPYLNPSAPQSIIKSESFDGLKEGFRGKELGRLNDGELADAFVHSFVEGIIKSQGSSEEIVLPFHNNADKNIFRVITANLSEDDFKRYIEKRGDQWSVNKSILTKMVSNLFSYQNEVSANSTKGLYSILVSSGLYNVGAIAPLSEMITSPHRMGLTLLDTWETVKNTNSPALFKTYNDFVQQVKKFSGLQIRKDFLLFTENVNGINQEIIMPGKAINYTYNYGIDQLNTKDKDANKQKIDSLLQTPEKELYSWQRNLAIQLKTSANPYFYAKYLNEAQGHSLFNMNNNRKLFKDIEQNELPRDFGDKEIDPLTVTEILYDRVKDVFGNQYDKFTDFLKSVQHTKPPAIQDIFIGSTGRAVYKRPKSTIKESVITDDLGNTLLEEEKILANMSRHHNWDWNPFYEGFFFAYMINDLQMSAMFMGDYSLYKDFTDFIKRSAKIEAPGIYPNTSDPKGIGKMSRVAIFNDPKSAIFQELDQYRATKGLPPSGRYEEFNGSGIMNTIWYHLFNRSFGGAIGSLGLGILKPVHSDIGLYLKYAGTIITGDMIENSPILAKIMDKLFISKELKEMFGAIVEKHKAEGKTFSKAYWDASKEMADYIGANGLQDQITAQLLPTTSVKEGASNINDINDEEYTTIGINNDYTRIQTNLEQDVQDAEISSYTQLTSQISVGIQNTERSSKLSNIHAEIADKYWKNIERIINKKMLKGGLSESQAWTEYLKKIAINATKEMSDIGFFVDLVNDPNSSINIPILRQKLKTYFANRITKNAIKPKMTGIRNSQTPGAFYRVYDFVDPITGEAKILTYADIIRATEAGLDMSSAVERKLRPMRMENGVVIPGDALIPYSYVEKFGISKDWTLEESRLFIKQFRPQDLPAFEATLFMLIGRLPLLTPASAFLVKAVGFINDSSNTIIFADEHNSLTNADNDGDQVNAYFYGLEQLKDGTLTIDLSPGNPTIQTDQNRILEIFFEYYNDPKNFDLIYSPVELDTFRDSVSEELSIIENKKNSYSPNTPTLFMYMSRLITEGKIVTGAFANALKVYSLLVQAVNVNNKKDSSKKVRNLTTFKFNPDGKNGHGQYVLDFLGKLVQSAVDNAKELILGSLGVNMNNSRIISAMATEGMSIPEAVNFISQPHIFQVFDSLYFSNRLGKFKRNNSGEKWSMIDQIEEAKAGLQNPLDTQIRVPADEKLANFNKAQNKKKLNIIDTEEDVDTFSSSKTEEERVGDHYNYISNPEIELTKILAERESQRNAALNDLDKLKFLELKGTALNNLTKLLSLNTAGIPVFEYETDKLSQEIDFILNQTLENYLSNSPLPVNNDFWKGHYRLISEEGMVELEGKQNIIRNDINIAEVIKLLPASLKNLELFNNVKQVYSKLFTHDSKFIKGVTDKFLVSIGGNSLTYENDYKAFNAELEKYIISLFFESQYAGQPFENILATVKGQAPIYVSTPKGRIEFGYQFPFFLQKEFYNANDTLVKDYADNKFLQAIEFAPSNNGFFVQLKPQISEASMGDEILSPIRNGFAQLPTNIQEMFVIYFLSKDGFRERKNSIMKIIGPQAFSKYSSFADALQEMIAKHDQGKPQVYTLPDGVMVPLDELFDTGFLKVVPSRLKNLLLTKKKLEERGIKEEDYPQYYRVSVKEGKYFHDYFVDKSNPEVLLKSKFVDTFNGYSPSENTIVSLSTLKRMNWDEYTKLYNRDYGEQGVEIKFLGQTSFIAGQKIHLINGDIVEVIRTTDRNSIFVRHILPVNVFAKMKEITPNALDEKNKNCNPFE